MAFLQLRSSQEEDTATRQIRTPVKAKCVCSVHVSLHVEIKLFSSQFHAHLIPSAQGWPLPWKSSYFGICCSWPSIRRTKSRAAVKMGPYFDWSLKERIQTSSSVPGLSEAWSLSLTDWVDDWRRRDSTRLEIKSLRLIHERIQLYWIENNWEGIIDMIIQEIVFIHSLSFHIVIQRLASCPFTTKTLCRAGQHLKCSVLGISTK